MSPEETIYQLVKDNYAKVGNPLDYVRAIVAPLIVEQLNQTIIGCQSCPIGRTSAHSCFKGTGNEPILVVGEYPLPSQQRINGMVVPYGSDTKEGTVFHKMFEAMCVDESRLAWINVINCLPTWRDEDGNIQSRPPTRTERTTCSTYLEYVIRMLQPKFLILVGNTALSALVPNGKMTIMQVHGQLMQVRGIPAVPIISPSYIIEQEKNGNIAEELQKQMHYDFQNDVAIAINTAHKMLPREGIIKEEKNKVRCA